MSAQEQFLRDRLSHMASEVDKLLTLIANDQPRDHDDQTALATVLAAIERLDTGRDLARQLAGELRRFAEQLTELRGGDEFTRAAVQRIAETMRTLADATSAALGGGATDG